MGHCQICLGLWLSTKLLVGGDWNMTFIFHYFPLYQDILGIIIPIDFHIFQRDRYTTNQICVHKFQSLNNSSLCPTEKRNNSRVDLGGLLGQLERVSQRATRMFHTKLLMCHMMCTHIIQRYRTVQMHEYDRICSCIT